MLAGIDSAHKPAEEIRVTIIELARPPVPPETLAAFLSQDEQDRAERFRFAPLREHFRSGRGMLRLLLGGLCGVPPGQLQFSYSEQGKPSLATRPDIHFNVSHSGSLWACALSYNGPLGLDIEVYRSLADRRDIAKRFFAPAEQEEIDHYREPESSAAFYRCWTRKEAYLKALGCGLSKGLGTFRVSCGEQAVSTIEDPAEPAGWLAHSFMPAPGYTGAVVSRAIAPVLLEHR